MGWGRRTSFARPFATSIEFQPDAIRLQRNLHLIRQVDLEVRSKALLTAKKVLGGATLETATPIRVRDPDSTSGYILAIPNSLNFRMYVSVGQEEVNYRRLTGFTGPNDFIARTHTHSFYPGRCHLRLGV